MSALKRLLNNEEAATAVEYAVMLALILMAVFASIVLVGTETSALWTTIDTDMEIYGLGQ